MSEEDSREDRDDGHQPPDPAVTPDLFREWRSPRFGRANPERMNNPVWEWLVKSRINAYQATQRMNGPSAMRAGPGWCFDRFGQSTTPLADGRVVLIAGEHEDSYDADFYIYNDVVVLHPDGRIDILGYPREIFPPTDFHSATLIGNRIVLLGSLGCPADRRPGTTPVAILDLETFAIAAAQTSGTPPGWIHEHSAVLSEDGSSILVERGKLDRGGEDRSLVENIDDWRLHLAEWRWEKLTERRWERWQVHRRDGQQNHLWQIQCARWQRDAGRRNELRKEMKQLAQELGIRPDLDLVARLYEPDVSHEKLPAIEDEPSVHRIKIDGIVVRYVDGMASIQMTVEGELPRQTIDALTADLRGKLSALENTECESVRL